MTSALAALSVITIGCVIAPIISHFVPHRLLPEVVLLLAFGVLVGPHGLGIVRPGPQLGLLHDIGMSMLFLLAGYEVDQRDLASKGGRSATFTWVVSLVLAFLVIGWRGNLAPFSFEGLATAIAMTATALGTLLPILKDRGLMGTGQGRFIMTHGAVGEVCPIILMAVLLSVKSTLLSLLLVLAFLVLTVAISYMRKQVVELGDRLVHAIKFEAETTAQLTVRLVAALMVVLIAIAEGMGIDLVLGAFLAGFIVRQTVPNGHETLDSKLDGLAYGFFIPIFFVIAGSHIDPAAIIKNPVAWCSFLVALVLVRGIPVFFSSFLPLADDLHKRMTMRQRLSASFYATTNLPIIVAVTQLAEGAKAMTPLTASTLVCAGVVSVLVMPFLAFVIDRPRAGEKAALK